MKSAMMEIEGICSILVTVCFEIPWKPTAKQATQPQFIGAEIVPANLSTNRLAHVNEKLLPTYNEQIDETMYSICTQPGRDNHFASACHPAQ
jgi:hypothetical protein